MTTQTISATMLFRAVARQRGMSLIELLGALAIGAVLLVGLMGMVDRSFDEMKGQQAAAYQAQLTDAARKYIQANGATLSANPGDATQTVTVSELRSAGFLPASFALLNVYQQGACVLIRKSVPAMAGHLDALVVGTGDNKIGEKILPEVAIQAGPGGGYISLTDFMHARGASWSLPTAAYLDGKCAGVAALSGSAADGGHLVSSLFYDGAGQLAADFLYRGAVPGQPELNMMSTPLLLGGAALVTAGGDCQNTVTPQSVAVAVDQITHALVSCDTDGKWMGNSWKAPVGDYNALVALAALDADDPKKPIQGDVRMALDSHRAFTYDGANWVALAVDQNGDFKVPGRVAAGNIVSGTIDPGDIASGDIFAAGKIHAVGHIETEGDLHVDGNSFLNTSVTVGIPGADVDADVTVNGKVTSNGVAALQWMATPAVSVGTTMLVGAACNLTIWNSRQKQNVIQYPYGTIVMETDTDRALICGPHAVFQYADGTSIK